MNYKIVDNIFQASYFANDNILNYNIGLFKRFSRGFSGKIKIVNFNKLTILEVFDTNNKFLGYLELDYVRNVPKRFTIESEMKEINECKDIVLYDRK